MNLAICGVSYYWFKFLSSTIGVSLLIMVVVTIGGIVKGVISDSSIIMEKTGADLWVVQAYGAPPQEGTLGPGWMAMPHAQRFIVIAYELGKIGGPPVIVAGREIEASHYEIVADAVPGFT